MAKITESTELLCCLLCIKLGNAHLEQGLKILECSLPAAQVQESTRWIDKQHPLLGVCAADDALHIWDLVVLRSITIFWLAVNHHQIWRAELCVPGIDHL